MDDAFKRHYGHQLGTLPRDSFLDGKIAEVIFTPREDANSQYGYFSSTGFFDGIFQMVTRNECMHDSCKLRETSLGHSAF